MCVHVFPSIPQKTHLNTRLGDPTEKYLAVPLSVNALYICCPCPARYKANIYYCIITIIIVHTINNMCLKNILEKSQEENRSQLDLSKLNPNAAGSK